MARIVAILRNLRSVSLEAICLEIHLHKTQLLQAPIVPMSSSQASKIGYKSL
jgi:hypothetical protein